MSRRIPATATFAAAAVLGLLLTVTVLVAPETSPLLRTGPSLIVALFVPGYLLICIIFPRRDDVDGLLRLGLSLALSFTVLILLDLVLSNTPFQTRRVPQVVGLEVVVLLLAVVALWRQQRLAPPARLAYTIDALWPFQRGPLTALGILLVAGIAAAAVIAPHTAGPAQSTEIYVPVSPSAPNPVMGNGVNVTVVSHEQQPTAFHVAVQAGDQVIGQSPSFTLAPGGAWSGEIAFTAPMTTSPAPVDLLLLKQGSATPYRHLVLWLHTLPYRPPS